jgi:hypothetical protein
MSEHKSKHDQRPRRVHATGEAFNPHGRRQPHEDVYKGPGDPICALTRDAKKSDLPHSLGCLEIN